MGAQDVALSVIAICGVAIGAFAAFSYVLPTRIRALLALLGLVILVGAVSNL
jgi:hypothetical protein